MLPESTLIKLKYLRVRFDDKKRALRILVKQNLPINYYDGYYYISPSQRRALKEEGIILYQS
jgi:hypothetical protein